MFLIVYSAIANAGTVLVVGDSLSAGYGLQPGQGWVELLQQRLQQHRPSYRVINASISGDTTAGGLSRIEGHLAEYQPDILLLELGANDGLRGLPLGMMKQNLNTIVKRAKTIKVAVVLIGMQMPPNYGRRYTERFYQVYKEVAAEQQLALVPFLLDGVVLDPELMQRDNLHPNASAQARLLENVWTVLEPLL